jgi:outer membrane protein, heavy metal efflux system
MPARSGAASAASAAPPNGSSAWNAVSASAARPGSTASWARSISRSRARLGEARHEAARALSDSWLEWLAAQREQALLKEQLSFAEANLAAVDKRQRAGDASMLDASVATSDLADVRRQALQADSALAKALAKLRLRFGEPPAQATALSDPAEPIWPEARWRERIVAEADPLKAAQAQVRKADLTASRHRADKLPDPTVGVFTASEAFRNERVVGVTLSMPLGGGMRERRLQQSLQEAEAARAASQRVRQTVELEFAETYADAAGGVARWRIAESGAQAARESARLTQRAYALGEGDLQSLLLVRRQSLDASRAAAQARAEALRWNYRLLIDAHLIWDLAND